MAASAEAPTGRIPNPGSLPTVIASGRADTDSGAVSWAAVLAGAAAAAALSLIMLMLGVGLGLSSVSPWANDGLSATALSVSTIVWLTFTQLAASGIGGYIAGRLRSRWIDVRRDEVRFRDTAHGFLAWAVASLATAALLTSVISGIIGAGVQGGAALVGNATATTVSAATATPSVRAALQPDSFEQTANYWIDSLFRRSPETTEATAPAGTTNAAGNAGNAAGGVESSAEVMRIVANALGESALPPDDARYLGQLVAQQTGLSQAEAEKRVTEVYQRIQNGWKDFENEARAKADEARKASAYAALWIFVSLLIGAFVASLAATWGGRQRDL